MRRGAVAQFPLGFGQRDVKCLLAVSDAFHQELKRDRGFAGARRAFDEKKVTAGKSACQNIVQSPNAGFGFCTVSIEFINTP